MGWEPWDGLCDPLAMPVGSQHLWNVQVEAGRGKFHPFPGWSLNLDQEPVGTGITGMEQG